jgi:hypothetical protein
MTDKRIAGLFQHDWRRLDGATLELRILAIKRASVRHHLGPQEWKVVDRMRKRLAEIAGEGRAITRRPPTELPATTGIHDRTLTSGKTRGDEDAQ